MNINYRQILVIVSVLILFELMSVGLKKCSKNDDSGNNYQSIFPLPLNDTTKSLLIGQWKLEMIGVDNQYLIELANFTKDSLVIVWHWHNLTRTLNIYNGKWSIDKNRIVFDYENSSDLGKIYFYNEDEFVSKSDIGSFTIYGMEKWLRIAETAHPDLYDNSK